MRNIITYFRKITNFDKKPTLLILENQKQHYQQFIDKYNLVLI